MQYVKLTNHTHAPNTNETIVAEFESTFNEHATTLHAACIRIINEALLSAHKDDAASQRELHANARKITHHYQVQHHFRILNIPQHLKLTSGGNKCLLYDNKGYYTRIIILSSDDNLHRLSSSEHWHADETFKVRKYNFIAIVNMINCT
ncbi:unnamed protein product [Rotaria sp. Silwood2]|nr:unnamed protein product [Rotaria sp. Silwood2]CAF4027301.1 unnamed protein product [Rotaria sp. Silwood2]